MCEVKVYLKDDDREELLMEDVVILRPTKDGAYIANLFGEEKTVAGDIGEVHFLDHKIVLNKK